MANLDRWETVMGEAFKKGVSSGAVIEGDDQKVNFTVKSDKTGKYINCTLWKNSHGHITVRQGDGVRVNGKVTTEPKKDGDGFWINLSVARIGIISMDSGVDDREPVASSGASDDEPDVL